MNLKKFPPKNYTNATFVSFCNMVHTDGLILRWAWEKLLKLAQVGSEWMQVLVFWKIKLVFTQNMRYDDN
jgi:hypothetical protein